MDSGLVLCTEARTCLRHGGEAALHRYLQNHWNRHRLRELLDHADAGVVTTAAMCLGLVGRYEDTIVLARCLHHEDYFVVNMSERALWSIWHRSSNEQCRSWLRLTVKALQDEDFCRAEKLLDRILIEDAGFAEACNQRAILYYLSGRYESSIMACRRTLALNPHHFGAAAGLGHNFFQLGRYEEATQAYRKALHIHPRMAGVRQAMRRTREAASIQGATLDWPAPVNTTISLASLARDSRES